MITAIEKHKKLVHLLKDTFGLLFGSVLFRKKLTLWLLWLSLLWVVFITFIYDQYLDLIFSSIGTQTHSFVFGDVIENNTFLAISILLLLVFFWLCLSNFCKIGILKKMYLSEGTTLKINNFFSRLLKIIFFSIFQIPFALLSVLCFIVGIVFEPLFIPVLVILCGLLPLIYSWSNMCFYHYSIQDNDILRSIQLATKNYKSNFFKNTLNAIITWNTIHSILVLFIYFSITILWPLIENLKNFPQISILYLYISTLIFLGFKSLFWINQISVFKNGLTTPLTVVNTTQLNHNQPSE